MHLKKALFGFCSLVTLSSLAMVIFKFIFGEHTESSAVITYTDASLIMLCNLGVVCTFDIAYMINAELFPTIVLATAYGACNIVGRCISITSPIVAKIPNPYPLFVLIIFSALCAYLSFKLKKI